MPKAKPTRKIKADSTKSVAKTPSTRKIKNDNIMNAASLIGVAGKAQNPATSFGAPVNLSFRDAENIYQGDGFGKKIIDVFADTMTREWITIKGDVDDKALKYMARLSTKSSINQSIKWGRVYGTSAIVMLIDDGGMLDEPVNLTQIKTIDSLRIVDKTQLAVKETSDLYEDPIDPNFGKIRVYTINPVQSISTTSKTYLPEYRVHESRMLRFDGELAPPRLMAENGHFGFSSLQAPYNYLRNLAVAYEMSAEILHDFVVSVISMKNLSSILSRPNGAEAVKARAEVMAYCKSVINGVIIDADGEQYDKITTSLSGLPELLDKFALALSAVTNIPYIILMGDTPSGLNATGANDTRSWYDSIANEQHDFLTVQLNKLLSYILAARDNPLKGKTMDDLEIVYNPLWQQSDTEIVDMRNKQAQSDQIYIENGVVAPEEIATSRFGGDSYSFETNTNNAAE